MVTEMTFLKLILIIAFIIAAAVLDIKQKLPLFGKLGGVLEIALLPHCCRLVYLVIRLMGFSGAWAVAAGILLISSVVFYRQELRKYVQMVKTIADCLPNLRWLENVRVESKPDYEAVYNQIIDSYSNIGQIDLGQAKENNVKGL